MSQPPPLPHLINGWTVGTRTVTRLVTDLPLTRTVTRRVIVAVRELR